MSLTEKVGAPLNVSARIDMQLLVTIKAVFYKHGSPPCVKDRRPVLNYSGCVRSSVFCNASGQDACELHAGT